MLKAIVVGLAVLVAGFLGYVALQPSVGVITRSAVIAAPAAQIFPHVNSFKQWEAWSPWAKLDPNSKTEFEGPDAGVGSIMKWSGNDEVGQGAMAIVESRTDEDIKIRMDFVKPFASVSDVNFAFKPEGDGTRVTWTMAGEQPFWVRAICILMQANRQVGAMFEKGLANLATASGAPAPAIQ